MSFKMNKTCVDVLQTLSGVTVTRLQVWTTSHKIIIFSVIAHSQVFFIFLS